MQPTLKQIAQLAGVSIGTVHRAIHKNGPVSKENQERIEKIIKQLNYKPNIMARSLVKGMRLNFSVIMPCQEQDGGYWKLPTDGINRAKYELQHLQVRVEIFYFDKFSSDSFIKAGKKALESQPEGLLIAPIQEEATRKFLSQIPENIPYIFFDSDIPNTSCLSIIHQDSLNSGSVAAKLMSLTVQESATLAVVRFFPNTFHIDQRMIGFIDKFSSISNYKLVVIDIPEKSSQENVQKQLDHLVSSEPDLKGIFVTDAHIFEVAYYFQSSNKQKDIALIGFDLIPRNIHYLKEKYIDFLISQHPDLQGYMGIQSLYRAVMLKEKIEPEIKLPIEIITQENVDFSRSYFFNEEQHLII